VDAVPYTVRGPKAPLEVDWGQTALPERLTSDHLRRWVSSGHSVLLSALNIGDSDAVRNVCWATDAAWPATSCSVLSFLASSKDRIALPPNSRNEDIIVIGIEGAWQLDVKANHYDYMSEGDSGEAESGDDSFPDLWPTPMLLWIGHFGSHDPRLLDASNGRRPAAFIPAGAVFDLRAMSEHCLCVVLTLQKPLKQEEVAAALIDRIASVALDSSYANDVDEEWLFPPVGTQRREMLAQKLERLAAQVRSNADGCMDAVIEEVTPGRQRLGFYRFDVNAWYETRQYDLESMLAANGGIVHIPDFLPEVVAKRCHAILDSMDVSSDWQTNVGDNPAHCFLSSTQFPHAAPMRNMLARLVPHRRAVISAARYDAGEFIQSHDDRAYRMIMGRKHSRCIAVVLYLTPGIWDEETGGMFIDHVTGQQYPPQFNSLVAFTVPRQHEVTPVTAEAMEPRFSLFGWFLEPGEKYRLDDGDESIPSRKHKRNRH
jgi:2OG-Fe(II) oxygenase superfamily